MAVDNKAAVVCLWIVWFDGLVNTSRANDGEREHAGVYTKSSHSKRLRLSASQQFHDAPRCPPRLAAVF
jgi:hypothetical protein